MYLLNKEMETIQLECERIAARHAQKSILARQDHRQDPRQDHRQDHRQDLRQEHRQEHRQDHRQDHRQERRRQEQRQEQRQADPWVNNPSFGFCCSI